MWLTGVPGSTHFGASGLNFALLAYLGLGGLLRREVATMAVSMAVMFYYGGMLRGVAGHHIGTDQLAAIVQQDPLAQRQAPNTSVGG